MAWRAAADALAAAIVHLDLFTALDGEPADVAGMALIAAGLAAIDGRPWRILLGWRPFS